ncbi:MAG: hypothetical protein ACOYKA_01265 [Legionellaceae bacterium]
MNLDCILCSQTMGAYGILLGAIMWGVVFGETLWIITASILQIESKLAVL